jgi:3-oxoadipate CoA-transferase beta subunit
VAPEGTGAAAIATLGWSPEELARRAYDDLRPGQYVNLGIGLPIMLLDAAARDPKEVVFHSENGILGLAALDDELEEDPDLIDAGKSPASIVVGGSYFSHAESFAMIRGGHIDVAVLGAYEVAVNGDFANWSSQPDRPLAGDPSTQSVPAVGGAVDLAAGAREVIVLLRNIRYGKRLRLVGRCSLPLTGARCVTKIYCDAGILLPTGTGFLVEEVAEGYSEAVLKDLFSSISVQIDIA